MQQMHQYRRKIIGIGSYITLTFQFNIILGDKSNSPDRHLSHLIS